jgi:hypothetical protein
MKISRGKKVLKVLEGCGFSRFAFHGSQYIVFPYHSSAGIMHADGFVSTLGQLESVSRHHSI